MRVRKITCIECSDSFTSTQGSKSKVCSDDCRKERKRRGNLLRNHKARGYSLYGFAECLICFCEFRMDTSRSCYCSSDCRTVARRKRKNEYQKRYHLKNKSNPEYILARMLRTTAGKISQKEIKSSRYCNFTYNEFRSDFEEKFKNNMDWGNWGEWHIDHIRPLSSFTFFINGEMDMKEVQKANSLSNLQPLWASENLKKHAKVNYES